MLFKSLKRDISGFFRLLQNGIEDFLFNGGVNIEFCFKLCEKFLACFKRTFGGSLNLLKDSCHLLVITLQKFKSVHLIQFLPR